MAAATGEILWSRKLSDFTSPDLWSLAWSPCGAKIATGCMDGLVRIVAAKGEVLHTLEISEHYDNPCVAWSPSGAEIAAGCATKGMRPGGLFIVSGATGSVQRHILQKTYVQCVAWSPSGAEIAVGVFGDSRGTLFTKLCIVAAATGAILRAVRLASLWDSIELDCDTNWVLSVMSLAWSPSGAEIATGCTDRKLRQLPQPTPFQHD